MLTSERAAEIGRKGGQATVQKYGVAHMQRIGKRGFTVTVEKYWQGDKAKFCDYLSAKGLAATVEKYWQGDKAKFCDYLSAKGLAAIDPVPANTAWRRGAAMEWPTPAPINTGDNHPGWNLNDPIPF